MAGLRIGSLSPILGGGSESFAYQFQRQFRDPRGAFYGVWDWPLFGSAHNVYAQTFAGKGAVGLLLLIALLAAMIVPPIRRAAGCADLPYSERVLLLACGTFGLAFLIYGNVQEVFYVQPLQFYFFAVLGMILSRSTPAPRGMPAWPACCLLLALAAHLGQLYYSRQGVFEAAQGRQWGCFAPEHDNAGEEFRWCGPRARIGFPVTRAADGTPALRFEVQGISSQSLKPELLVFSWKGSILHQQVVFPGQRMQVSFELSRQTAPDSTSLAFLDVRCALYAVPARDLRNSRDLRLLSYRLFFPGSRFS